MSVLLFCPTDSRVSWINNVQQIFFSNDHIKDNIKFTPCMNLSTFRQTKSEFRYTYDDSQQVIVLLLHSGQ